MPPADAGVSPPATGPTGPTRHLPRWLLLLAGALLVARIGTGIYEERNPTKQPELVHWRPIATAVAEARQAKKPILYDFTAEWCPPCRAMQREVFADPRAAQQLDAMFVPVRVLDRQREEGRNSAAIDSLQRRFKIDSFPTLVIVPPEGGDSVVVVGYPGAGNVMQSLVQAQMRLQMGRSGFPVMPGARVQRTGRASPR